jgi:hypothetical protein
MRDEMDARLWVEHHEQFSSGLADLFAKAREGLARLNAIQFDAPWKRDAARGPGQA